MQADIDRHHPHEQERDAQEQRQPLINIGDFVNIDSESGIAHLTHHLHILG